MAFRISERKLTAAVGSVLKGADDLCAGSHGASVDRIGVWNSDVDTRGLDAAKFYG
jgi:hypothetical protein